MPRYRKMIKSFLFEESERRHMADLNSGVRLNPKANRLEITPVGTGYYPTTLDLHARTRLTTPNAVRKWAGFFAIIENKKVSGSVVTDVRFRLNNGTNDLYWNSGANDWVVASPNNWNTEQEVADHIESFSGQSIQVVINLSTQNEGYTPCVYEVRILYETDLIFLEDYVVRSFKEDLLENVRPISKHTFASSGETSVTLDLQIPYDIIDVDSVYNDTTDPNHLSPLTGVSFNASTKVVTFPAQTSGNLVTIRFLWRPYVVLTRSQDYTEIAKIPVILIDDTSLENERIVRNRPFVINKGTGDGFVFEEAFQADIRMPLAIITAKKRDLHVLADELGRYFSNNNFLRSRGQDEEYPYRVEEVFNDQTIATQKEVFTGRLIVHIGNAVFYKEDAKPITGVRRFTVTGGNVDFEVSA